MYEKRQKYSTRRTALNGIVKRRGYHLFQVIAHHVQLIIWEFAQSLVRA